MVLQRLTRRWTASPSTRRLHYLKRRRPTSGPKTPEADHGQAFSEVMRRNIALEAVRVGNYYAEDQEEVLRYIAEVHIGVKGDNDWIRKNWRKLQKENGLTRRYSVPEILQKKHEADGFDVFVDPDEAILMAERAQDHGGAWWIRQAEALTRPELTAADAEEIQEGLDSVLASANAAPLSVEEIFELLERCVSGGEVAAAVYLAETLEARHEASPPKELVERIFQGMKTLLRPSAHAAAPKLAGPWLKAPAGRYGTLNPRKALGRLFERLAPLRRDPQDAAARMAEVNEALERLSHSLLPVLLSHEQACRCRRRGPLAALIASVASEQGLKVSPALAQAIFQHMESEGLLEVKGRDVALLSDQSVKAKVVSTSPLQSLYTDLPMLEAHAKKRLERRKQRQQARQATKRRKKQT